MRDRDRTDDGGAAPRADDAAPCRPGGTAPRPRRRPGCDRGGRRTAAARSLVTCRASWEGGGFRGSEEERERMLSDAQSAGAEYIDVEARAEFVPAITRRRRGRGIVLSFHAFGGRPGGLAERARAMRSTGAEMVKIAIEAERLTDTLPLIGSGIGSRLRRSERHGRTRAARDGSGWRRHAGPGRTAAEPLDLRRRRRGARADSCRPAARRVRLPPDPSRRHALRRGRQYRSRIRSRPSCTTPASTRWA